MLFHINKHVVYLTANKNRRRVNLKMNKIYTESTLWNIVKTGSEQIEQMSFFSSLFNYTVKVRVKVFFEIIG